jgi:hypothetical protein
MDFDASIDLPTDVVASPIPLHQAAEQLPGAFWISVEWCGQMPSVVYRRSRGGHHGRPPMGRDQGRQ